MNRNVITDLGFPDKKEYIYREGVFCYASRSSAIIYSKDPESLVNCVILHPKQDSLKLRCGITYNLENPIYELDDLKLLVVATNISSFTQGVDLSELEVELQTIKNLELKLNKKLGNYIVRQILYKGLLN